MDISTVDQTQYRDLFQDAVTTKVGVRFGSGDSQQADILSTTESTTEQTTASTTEATTQASTGETTTAVPTTDVDLLAVPTKQPGRPLKDNFKDLTGYFEDRLKSGKFVAVNDVDEQGNEVSFIPKTPEEFDEVIDIQVNYKLDQRKKELDQKWYQSKSPAWQAVAKYAELTDDPSEILPFLQGVRTIESVQEINAEDLAGAEQIVRTRMERRGESSEVIDEQIEALKTTEKLISTAQKYKPLILQEEKYNLSQLVEQKQQEDREYNQMVVNIRDGAIKAIEAPIFGKQKLKQDEKAVIYSMIALPSEESQGYPIYTEIDNLFAKGDFETLKQVALLLSKKENFLNYASASAVDKVSTGLQRQLRVATDSRTSPGNSSTEDGDTPSVQRTRYTSKFGSGGKQ